MRETGDGNGRAPLICPFCEGRAPVYEIVPRFAGCAHGHLGCRRCPMTFDDNVNALLDVPLDAGAGDDDAFRRLFVETPRIASETGQVYPAWDWEDADAPARGVVAQIAAAIGRHSDPGRVTAILDVGCGNGFTSVGLARTFAGARVLALDPSPQVLDAGRAARVRAVSGTLESLDAAGEGFAEGFDVVVMVGNFMLHANPVRTLERVGALMRPGAILVLDFKNARASVRRLTARLVRLGAGRWLPRGLRERAFLNMRYGFETRAVRALAAAQGLEELGRRTLPPRLLAFRNRAAFQSGWKGAVWRLLDGVDRLRGERAWVEMVFRRPG